MIYKDSTKSTKARVKDLMKRMTLKEKVAQLCATLPHMLLEGEAISQEKLEVFIKDGIGRIPQFPMPFIKSARQVAEAYNAVQKFAVEKTRLGIPFLAQVECLNGVTAVDATSFPAPIAMASTWEPELVEKAGKITGKQMRAMTNGSNALSPVVDLARDPRWGRVYETYGECSYLSSEFGTAFVKGLQNDGDFKTGVQSCAKHFLGYSYTQGGLNSASIEIGQRDLYDAFARPFETMIHQADLRSVMCTYSEIDGIPVSFSKEILRDLLRDKMGFSGSAICDGGSIERAYNMQRAAHDMQDAAVLALKAGLDADAPMTQAYNLLPDAVNEGKVNKKLIDEACARVLTQKFDLGLFDNPYVDIDKIDEQFSDENNDISLELSRKSVILLENKQDILPLNKDIKKVAVIGPHGDSIVSLFAGYTFPASLQAFFSQTFSMEGVNDAIESSGGLGGILESLGVEFDGDKDKFIENYCRKKYKANTVLDEIQNKLQKGSVIYSKGCNVDDYDETMFKEALNAAKKADIVIMTLGGKCGWSHDTTSGEGRDRASIQLPGVQEKLLKEIKKAGKPMILTLFNGRPMAINWAKENMDAILEVWFTGPQGGKSIADAIFGDINPGGKLPVTIPRHEGQIPIYYNHKIGSGYDKEGGTGNLEAMFGGGYTDIESTPLYYFGYGKSYTQFEFVDYDISDYRVDINGRIKLSAYVKNAGKTTGDEVVQFYMRDLEARVTRPVKELVGFKRVKIEPNEIKKVTLELEMSQLGFLNEDMEFAVEPGNIKVMIGNSADDIYFTDTFEIVGKKKRLEGRRTYLSKTTQETVKEITKTEHEIIIKKKNYSMKTTLGELLNDKDAKKILAETFGEELLNNPQLEKAKGMSLKMIKMMAGNKMPKEAMDKVLEELKKL